jgi:hypothetical protein
MRTAKVLILLLLATQTGCFSMSSQELRRDQASEKKESITEYFPVWTFNDVATIESIVRNQLGVTGTTAAETEILTYLRDHRAELGAGNFALGKPDNLRPEPGKFKYLTEVYADACFVGLAKTNVYSGLFPTVAASGSWDLDSFKQIFLKIMGREPSEGEKRELLALVQKLPATSTPTYLKKAAGACTVVLSSLEASNSR